MKSFVKTISLIALLTSLLTPAVFAAKFNWSSPITIPVGTEKLIDLSIDTQGESITGADAVINYDPHIISITKIKPAPSQPFPVFSTNINPQTGQAYIKASHSQLTQSGSGIIPLANLTIVGQNPGKSDLSLTCTQNHTSDSNLTEKDTANDILTCNLIKNTYIQVEPVTTNLIETIEIKAKFVGVNQDVGPIPALIQIGSRNNPHPLAEINTVFTYSDNGHYSTTLSLKDSNLSQNSNYWLTVKGEKHLQRAFNNLNFTAKNIVLNATSRPLEPGDLPNQDGKVDSHDINKLLAVLSKATVTTNDLATTDLNYDGTINSIDLSLLLATLATKPDEPTP